MLLQAAYVVNFYSHLSIASLYTHEAGIAFGSMLPDFASLVGAKPPLTSDPSILRGYALHHATDRVFHESELFRRACVIETRNLQALGIERGTAVAAAHVGLELLLDDALSEDEPARALFWRSLEAASPIAVSRSLHWHPPEKATRFEALRQRLRSLPVPGSTSSSSELAERICRTLSTRPRLAVRTDDRALLRSWADEVTSRHGSIWPRVIEVVVLGLGDASWGSRAGSMRRLRFRRAHSG